MDNIHIRDSLSQYKDSRYGDSQYDDSQCDVRQYDDRRHDESQDRPDHQDRATHRQE